MSTSQPKRRQTDSTRRDLPRRRRSRQFTSALRRLLFEPLEDRRLLTVDLVSVTPVLSPFTTGNMASTNPMISASGKYVVFQSVATNLATGLSDVNGADDIFVRDLEAGITIPISVIAAGGRTGDGASFDPAISDDGRFVTFVSAATNLIAGVTIDSTANVYVRDRDADGNGIFDEAAPGATATRLLSVGEDGTSGDGLSGSPLDGRPVISGNGAFVAFASSAPDLSLADDTQTDGNGFGLDVFRASTDGGKLTLISVNVDGTSSCEFSIDAPLSTNPSISGSGELVAFQSRCDDIVALAEDNVEDTNATTDVFVGSGARASLVSINADGKDAGNAASREPVISRDGRHVAFISAATDLALGATDTNAGEDVFVRDLKNERTTLVSRRRATPGPLATGNGASPAATSSGEFVGGPAISETGRFVVFQSAATDLLDPTGLVEDNNGMPDLFVFDRDFDEDGVFDEADATRTMLVSVNSAGDDSPPPPGGPCASFAPSISRDGRYVAFASTCDDLVAGVDGANIYVRDLIAETTAWISSTVSGGAGGALSPFGSRAASMSAIGDRVAFVSDTLAPDLDPAVTADLNAEFSDVFVGTPPTDIRLTSNFASGMTTHRQGYRIFFDDATPFDVGYYRSTDDLFNAGDDPLGTITVDDLDDLIADGNRVLSTTIGTGAGEIALPGVGTTDPDEDYFILTVGDNLNAVSEFDDDPFNEDNTSSLRGLYHVVGAEPSPVFVHGRPGGDAITAISDGTTLTVAYGTTGAGTPRDFEYDVADVSELRVRSHAGDDDLTGSKLRDVFFGGEGNDRLDGGAGDDYLDGGPGKDTIFGGPGADTIFDGCGDDIVDAGPDDDVVMSTPCSDDIFDDGGGNDTIDFSLDDLEITLDLDSTAVQTVDTDLNTIQLVGVWENFVGSPLGNVLRARPLPGTPRVLTGGISNNDGLIIDAGGNRVINDGTTFTFPGSGLGDITYSGFEDVRVINATARIIDDGDAGYSAPGFTRQFDPLFPQGFNGDIEFSGANDGNTATWTFNDVAPGVYAVSATWTSAQDRSSGAPFTIRDGGSNGTVVSQVRVDQEVEPGEFEDQGVMWQNLDLVRITGNTLTVELTDVGADEGANDDFEFVIADAVRIEPINADPPIIVDDAPNYPRAGAVTPTVFQSTGANAFAFIQQVIAFQTAIGGPDNGDTPGSQGSGARQVNWDNVDDAHATPNFLPVEFFNSTFTRGLQLSTAGDGFQVSGSALSPQAARFDNLNGTYDSAFASLSPERLFTPIGDNVFDVEFSVPGTRDTATVSGFGAVFTDVDVMGSSQMQFFDASGEQLLSHFVPATPGDGSLSFLGVTFDDPVIARVRITAGDGALLTTGSPDDITQGGPSDLVVMDDFIYGEPVPLPDPVANAGFASDCSAISGPGFLGDQHNCSAGQQASWDFAILPTIPDGTYYVSARWPAAPAFSDEVRYVYDDGSTRIESQVNQQLPPDDFADAGHAWERLFAVNIANGQLPVITASDPEGGEFAADAIRLDSAPRASRFLCEPVFPDGIDSAPLAPFSMLNDDCRSASDGAVFRVPRGVRATETLVVRNTGDANLQVGTPTVSGNGYSLIADFEDHSIPPGGFATFTVQFESNTTGLIDGQFAFPTNVLGQNSILWNLTADVFDDVTPPTVEIVAPDPGAVFIEGTSIPVTVDVNDDTGIHAINVLIDNIISGAIGSSNRTVEVTLPRGKSTAEIGAAARDLAGNTSDAIPFTVNLVPDQPPTVTLVRPFDGDGVIEGSTIAVRVEATDDVRITDVELRLNGVLQEVGFFDLFVAQLQLPNSAGDQTIEACATDTSGQVACDTAIATTFPPPAIDYGSIVVTPDAGHPPIVKVFQPDGTETFRFFAYEPGFLGGVRVATGDINGDGTPDIITGAGPGGGPHVKVFDGLTGETIRSFFAYDADFRGGVFVSAGDINGDGHEDIVTAAGAGGGPHVRVFDGVTGNPLAEFQAFDPAFLGGVRIAAGDVTGDGQADILATADQGGDGSVRVFDGHGAAQLQLGLPIPPSTLLDDFIPFGGAVRERPVVGDFDADGVDDMGVWHPTESPRDERPEWYFLRGAAFGLGNEQIAGAAAGDFNNDGRDDLVAGVGAGDGIEPQVRVFDVTDPDAPDELASFTAFAGFAGGVFVAAPRPPSVNVVNLPSTGGIYETFIDDAAGDLVVRVQGGGELFRQPLADPTPVRVNGAANADDLLIIKTLGTISPRLVFDGGTGGNDAMRLLKTTPQQQPLQYLQYRFENLMVTGLTTDGQSVPQVLPLVAVDLEPIADELEVVDRVFTFPADSVDNIVFNTGDSAADTILRIDSNNSEVVDFEQPTGSLTIESGTTDTVDIGTGWVFDDTEVFDGKFARVFTRDGLTLRMVGPRDWSNPVNALDVNANGSVEPLDVLIVINEVNDPKFHNAFGELTDAALLQLFPDFFFDTNLDGFVAPLDVLVIINFFNSFVVGPEGEEGLPAPLIGLSPALPERAEFISLATPRPIVRDAALRRDVVRPPAATLPATDQFSPALRRMTKAIYDRALDEWLADLNGDLSLGQL